MTDERKSLIDRYGPGECLHLLGIGFLAGLPAGLVSLAYRWIIQRSEHLRVGFVSGWDGSLLWLGLAVLGLLGLGLLLHLLLKWEPMSAGGGVSTTKAELDGRLEQRWWSVLLAKFFGGALSVVAGFSLGREGPTVQLGAVSGKAAAKLRQEREDEPLYIVCGVAAALAATFNAPLAGIAFACEEVYRRLNFKILIPALAASVTATVLSSLILGVEPLLHFAQDAAIPLSFYPFLILLGLACGAAGRGYNLFLGKARQIYERLIPRKGFLRLLPALVLSLVFALLCPEVMGTGEAMLELLAAGGLPLGRTALLLLLKFAFFAVCFCSAAPGGSFFPVIVLGAYLGAFCGGLFGLPEEWQGCFILLGTAGFFASAIGTPITAILLLAEMSRASGGMLSYCLVALVAFATSHILRAPQGKLPEEGSVGHPRAEKHARKS